MRYHWWKKSKVFSLSIRLSYFAGMEEVQERLIISLL
jgi:hypothetical protein